MGTPSNQLPADRPRRPLSGRPLDGPRGEWVTSTLTLSSPAFLKTPLLTCFQSFGVLPRWLRPLTEGQLSTTENAISRTWSLFRRSQLGLSERPNCPAWAVLNHDDDILAYELYLGGVLVEYDSTPDYFDPSQPSGPKGGDAARLAGAFGCETALSTIREVLRRSSHGAEGYVFAVERHTDLARALGIPPGLVCLGYNYLEAGVVPEGFSTEQFTRVS